MHLLLTGATGYLGKHLLAGLLRAGHRVTALVRGGDPARLATVLQAFELPSGLTGAATLTVLDGDVTRADCGLDETTLAQLTRASPAAFLHCAGLTRFEAHLADELQRHNVDGSRIAWQLAQRLGIPVFHHVSTAYVAGRTRQPFGAADLDCGQAFNNPYEASKFAAECELRAAAAATGAALVIHRPSIVVGGHPLGEHNAVSTLYTFMKAVQFIRECCRRDEERGRHAFARLGFRRTGEDYHVPVRVAADPASTVNLVAIDDVVSTVLAALAQPVAGIRTCALTGSDIPIADIERAITGVMRLSGVSLVDAQAFDAAPRNAIEAHFHRVTQVYAPYLFASPSFAPRPHASPVDPVALTRDFLAQLGGGRRRRAPVGQLALGTLGIHLPRDYFSALADGAVGRHFLARHAYVNATIGFALSGSTPDVITLRFAQGTATALPADAFAGADCRYDLDAALLMRIVRGEADLRASFLAGKVRITGNTELALKFGSLLGMYYRHLDDHVLEELTA